MRKFAFLLVAIFSLSFSVNAQNVKPGKITGAVLSSEQNIISATVSLFTIKDSTLVKMAVSGKEGKFEFENVKNGAYYLQVSAVGYQSHATTGIEISDDKKIIVVPSINLKAIPKAMQAVVVTATAKKPLIEVKPGKTIVNVEASPSNSGISALDVLEKSPGVSVDKDGNISLRGKQGVMILIDGKPSYLSGADLANLLKNMQSNNLDQIEIMTNPPAKYDAAGNSGIINIKTKKLNTKGINGNASASYTQGLYGRANSNLSLNYRNNKINIFGTYGLGRYEGYNNLNISRRFYKADKVTLAGSSDQISRPYWQGYYHNVKAGADYYFSKKDVVGIVVNGNFSNGDENPFSNSNVRDAQGNIIYSLQSVNDNFYKFTGITSNVNYKHTFDSTGREISADLDYAVYDKRNNTLLTTRTFDAQGNSNANPVSLKGLIPSNIKIYSAKVDYVHPFNKTTKLEAGAKSSYVTTDNKVDYTRNDGGAWYADNRSNHFLYNENINAAYATVSKHLKKWNLIAGVRVENTIAHGKQMRNDSTFTRNYTNVFPNLGIGYEASEKHQFNLSYSRRIDRPDYDDLNPFTFFLDSLTYGQGNPYLQPQFTNNIEASHTFNRFLTTTVNYSQTDDVITQLLKQDTEKKVTYQTRENIARMRQLGLAVTFNKSVKKWWSTNVYLNVFNNQYTGFYQADPIDISYTAFSTNISNNFSFKNGWGAELSGFYRSKTVDGLLVARSFYAVNAGVSKQVLKKKGNIRLSIRDIFFTQRFSGYARYSDVDVDLTSRRDSRQVNLSFTYRFGKNTIAPARRRTGGAGDEQSRVKSGN